MMLILSQLIMDSREIHWEDFSLIEDYFIYLFDLTLTLKHAYIYRVLNN